MKFQIMDYNQDYINRSVDDMGVSEPLMCVPDTVQSPV